MRIVLLTSARECAKCRQAKEIIQRVSERNPSVETLLLRTDDPQAARYGVVLSPTVIVDDTIVASGRAPNERKLLDYIDRSARGDAAS